MNSEDKARSRLGRSQNVGVIEFFPEFLEKSILVSDRLERRGEFSRGIASPDGLQ
ncbi:hypothetical protein AB1L42_22970 [Thalassoglobus sp. JC818]|uniref:hypothetical protein n=1 Tax=Thalassoglobus sp. JC818 TaxID=3232136 RepID=UPI00345A0EA7